MRLTVAKRWCIKLCAVFSGPLCSTKAIRLAISHTNVGDKCTYYENLALTSRLVAETGGEDDDVCMTSVQQTVRIAVSGISVTCDQFTHTGIAHWYTRAV